MDQYSKSNSNVFYYALVIVLMILGGCKDKPKHFETYQLDNGIYVETFVDHSGGTYASSYYSYYVTDSLGWREFVSKCDEDEKIEITGYPNKIVIKRYSEQDGQNNRKLVDSSTIYIGR